MAGENLRVDRDRLWNDLSLLGQIGAYDDPAGTDRGVCRLALTDADAAGRRFVRDAFERAGLHVCSDAFGNTFGRREGTHPDLAPILIGSHIDSVATAGRFDGCLGVLGGLEVLRTLADRGVVTRHPLEVAFFTEEEGVRFGTDMLGSAVACGRISLEAARVRGDRDGVTAGAELDRLGLAGPRPVPMPAPAAYLECHIEQGPILHRSGCDIGVVTGMQAISWLEIDLTGQAAHAGTTPVDLRRNATLVAGRFIAALDDLTTSGAYGAALATVGRLDVTPNLVNIVPSRVIMTVDLRNTHAGAMARLEADVGNELAALGRRHGVGVRVRRTAATPPIGFSPAVQDIVAAQADRLGLVHRRISSGAGHDAGEFATRCPTGMIFVPGERDGISHNPAEYSTPKACGDGIDVLLHTVLAIDA